jgi:hypothetical protein
MSFGEAAAMAEEEKELATLVSNIRRTFQEHLGLNSAERVKAAFAEIGRSGHLLILFCRLFTFPITLVVAMWLIQNCVLIGARFLIWIFWHQFTIQLLHCQKSDEDGTHTLDAWELRQALTSLSVELTEEGKSVCVQCVIMFNVHICL